MARAAGNARDQAARLGLLVALAGCASIQEPPGGPPDFTGPVVLSVVPDSGSVAADFDDDAVIQFDEVISERSGSGLENLVRLSPRAEEVSVSWKRSRITIKPKGGWRSGVVYHLTLLPGVTDLSNNRLDSGLTTIFSTGGPIPDTRLTGTVLDWDQGRAATDALIEAILLPDSLTYVARSDSVGDFTITAIPAGSYLLVATVDQNNNGLRDSREGFDSATVRMDSTANQVLWAFAHDTVGPRMTATAVDSITLRVEFTQKLAPGSSDSTPISVFSLPDTVAAPLAHVWTEQVYDSVRAQETALADSIAVAAAAAADSLAADSAAVRDSLPEVPQEPRERRPELAEVGPEAAEVTPDTSRATLLLPQRPPLIDVLIIRMAAPLTPDAQYLVIATAINVAGAVSEPQAVLVAPAVSDSS